MSDASVKLSNTKTVEPSNAKKGGVAKIGRSERLLVKPSKEVLRSLRAFVKKGKELRAKMKAKTSKVKTKASKATSSTPRFKPITAAAINKLKPVPKKDNGEVGDSSESPGITKIPPPPPPGRRVYEIEYDSNTLSFEIKEEEMDEQVRLKIFLKENSWVNMVEAPCIEAMIAKLETSRNGRADTITHHLQTRLAKCQSELIARLEAAQSRDGSQKPTKGANRTMITKIRSDAYRTVSSQSQYKHNPKLSFNRSAAALDEYIEKIIRLLGPSEEALQDFDDAEALICKLRKGVFLLKFSGALLTRMDAFNDAHPDASWDDFKKEAKAALAPVDQRVREIKPLLSPCPQRYKGDVRRHLSDYNKALRDAVGGEDNLKDLKKDPRTHMIFAAMYRNVYELYPQLYKKLLESKHTSEHFQLLKEEGDSVLTHETNLSALDQAEFYRLYDMHLSSDNGSGQCMGLKESQFQCIASMPSCDICGGAHPHKNKDGSINCKVSQVRKRFNKARLTGLNLTSRQAEKIRNDAVALVQNKSNDEVVDMAPINRLEAQIAMFRNQNLCQGISQPVDGRRVTFSNQGGNGRGPGRGRGRGRGRGIHGRGKKKRKQDFAAIVKAQVLAAIAESNSSSGKEAQSSGGASNAQ